jgi:ABC-type thiamin/hydroxymethylpyrimidine transport system permease subunit
MKEIKELCSVLGKDKMKKDYVLGILFFSGLWGISEAVLGDVLYRAQVPYASIPLTIIGFIVLTFSRVFFPHKGTATMIAALAMLYKFLNVPFFACHLLGIFITGLCYDLFFSVLRIKNRSLSAAAAVYSSYTLFALMITYIFRYENWTQGGIPKILQHVLISGSIAAFGCTILVPVSFNLAQRHKANLIRPFNLRFQLAPSGIFAITTILWSFGLLSYIY